MSEEVHKYIVNLVSSWPQQVADETEPDIVSTTLLSEARRWFSACRDIIPVDQPVVMDYRARELLDRVAIYSIRTGYNGQRWRFSDHSAIVSNSDGDKVRER